MKFLILLSVILIILDLIHTDHGDHGEEEPQEETETSELRGLLSLPETFSFFIRQPDRVKFFLHLKGVRSDITHVDGATLKSLINRTKPIKLFVHGFMSHSGELFPTNLIHAFRNATDEQCNFVSIDWSCSDGTYTCQNPFEYCQIVKKVNWIGRQVGDFLVRMHNLLHLDGATTWCYGHSLGSHICGGAGRRFFASLRTKIFSIIAMDPAGPGFLGNDPLATPLESEDATHVVAIITDGMKFGMPTINVTTIYLNGGGRTLQPVCEANTSMAQAIWSSCGHSSSHVYFTASVWEFPGPGRNRTEPLCADIPNGTATISLGDGIATLDRNTYFLEFKKLPPGFHASSLQSNFLRAYEGFSASELPHCFPGLSQGLSNQELPRYKRSCPSVD